VIGPDGSTGLTGSTGPDGSTGPIGPAKYDTTYLCTTDQWINGTYKFVAPRTFTITDFEAVVEEITKPKSALYVVLYLVDGKNFVTIRIDDIDKANTIFSATHTTFPITVTENTVVSLIWYSSNNSTELDIAKYLRCYIRGETYDS
jgi:hypothetical protein